MSDSKHYFLLKKIRQFGRGTMYSKSGLSCQLAPSLEITYVLRELFQVPGGKGLILNIEHGMRCIVSHYPGNYPALNFNVKYFKDFPINYEASMKIFEIL